MFYQLKEQQAAILSRCAALVSDHSAFSCLLSAAAGHTTKGRGVKNECWTVIYCGKFVEYLQKTADEIREFIFDGLIDITIYGVI